MAGDMQSADTAAKPDVRSAPSSGTSFAPPQRPRLHQRSVPLPLAIAFLASLTAVGGWTVGEFYIARRAETALGDIGNPTTPSLEFDFGNARQATSLLHTFELRNDFPQVIRVERIHSSCGCTTATDTIAGREVQPGMTLPVPVRLTTGASQGNISGDIAVVSTYDQQQFMTVMRVKANVKPDFYIEPQMVDFGQVDPTNERQSTQSLTIIPAAFPDLAIENMHCSNKHFDARLRPAAMPGDPPVRDCAEITWSI